MTACSDCATKGCIACDEFEQLISNETDINLLKQLRKGLIMYQVKLERSIGGVIADWLTTSLGTMTCVVVFLLFANSPFVFPKWTEFVQFVGGTDIPLVLMPLLLIAGIRSDKIRELKTDRENRIQLIYDRIEELREEGGRMEKGEK